MEVDNTFIDFPRDKTFPQNDPRFTVEHPHKPPTPPPMDNITYEQLLDAHHKHMEHHNGINVNNGFLDIRGGHKHPGPDPRFDMKNPPWADRYHTHKKSDIEDLKDFIEDRTYVHKQATPSSVWTIQHNLNKYPAVSVIDSSNREVFGDVEYLDLNSVRIIFSGAFSGKATLN